MSQRFHCSVQLIWNTPHRRLYFQLFALFAVLFYLVALRFMDPSFWESILSRHQWAAQLHVVHSMIQRSTIGMCLLSTVSLLYLMTASGVIFLFWKTSLRVLTVADAGLEDEKEASQGERFVAHAHSGEGACGLCQLGLCLDNIYM